METQVEQGEEKSVHRAGGMFRALSHRNFRLFWTGAFLSNVGTWMQAVAQALLMYNLTRSPFLLGLDGFMATAPGLVLVLAGGVFADLVDRKRLLIYTQIGAGASALLLGTLVVTNVVQWWMILCLSFVTGCCMSLAGPSYQALTIDLVGREDLTNAIALNSTQFQFSRVVGPALAGIGLSLFGVAGCFFLNGFSFIAIVVALSMVRFDDKENAHRQRPVKDRRALWQDLINGFRYVWSRGRVFMLLLISAVTSLFGAPYFTLIPVFARDVLHVGDTGVALLMGAAGGGAFCGALVLTFLGDFRRKGWSVIGGAFLFGVFIIGFSFSKSMIFSLATLFGSGFSIVFSVAVVNTLLQKLVTDEMRGRVMSMFILSFIGTLPFGNLMAGAASHRFGAPHTLAVGGVIVSLFVAIVGWKSERLRELS
jgi:predicted MFS family arabinose efflux permease